jgi:uncharacterized protein (TIGR04255 family)
VNALKPYPEWPSFSATIDKVYNALAQVIEVQSLSRIGLRYVNRFEIPKENSDLKDYLALYPSFGKSLPESLPGFHLVCSWAYEDGRDVCRTNLVEVVPDTVGHRGLILDFDYFLAKPETVQNKEAMKWLEKAHERIEDLFEGCITDRLRSIFKEVK